MKNISLVCINCPLGCSLSVTLNEDGTFCSVTGNTCPRGAQYAEEEVTSPKRMLTSTVRTDSGEYPRLPVVSSAPLPKERLLDCAQWLTGIKATLPVTRGEVIVQDILGTGVDMVASRSLRAV